MNAKHLPMLFIVAVLIPPRMAMAQQMTPKDINYLAHLWDSNRGYYERYVTGVATFSGIGIVLPATKGWESQLEVDFGRFGDVMCLGVTRDSLRPGDRVKISGSVGGASTAQTVIEMNRIGDQLRSPRLREKDALALLTGTCAVEKVN